MPSAAWPGEQSKASELTHLTLVMQGTKRCMAWGAIEGNRTHPLTRVAQDAKRFMALGAIEGNQTDLFDSGSAGCQALHGLGCIQTHPVDLGSTGCQALHGLGGN